MTFTYNGDNNYASETLTTGQYPFVVVAGSSLTPSVTTASLSGAISPNSTLIVSGTVTGSGTTAPTGYVLFFSSGYDLGVVPLTPATGDVSTFSATITSQDILQGANFITVGQYLGDTRYAPSEFTFSSPLQNPLSDFTLVPNTTLVPVNISAGASSGTVTINVASVNSFSGNVNLTCKATSPVTCSITSPVALSRGSSGTSTLTINAPANTPTGSYDVSVVGADAATGEFVHTLSITASVSAFTLTNGGNIVVVQGATTGNTSTIAVTPASGFTGAVNLSCAVTSAPAGATNPVTCSTANLNPASVNITGAAAQTSILTINTDSSTSIGDYQITVTGTSGSITSSTTLFVTVDLPQDFAVNKPSPPPITINQGATAGNTSAITVTPSGGFTGVALGGPNSNNSGNSPLNEIGAVSGFSDTSTPNPMERTFVVSAPNLYVYRLFGKRV